MPTSMSMRASLSRLALVAMFVSLGRREAICQEKPRCGGGEPIRVHGTVGLAKKEVS